jgi:putative nucleotidyltransferase with HDIG domain
MRGIQVQFQHGDGSRQQRDRSGDAHVSPESGARRYEAVVRISEALAACREPEELARTLADQLNEFLGFDHLDVMVLKENSSEIEWHAWGKGELPLPELPPEDLRTWHVYNSLEPLHIPDWCRDERFPRLKQFTAEKGIRIGPVIRVPLTTPHRHLGTLGIASAPGVRYSTEDVDFLRLIARVVAFAIDDGINLRRAQAAQACLQRQNDRLQLLLNLTNRITSNLELKEVLRAIATNVREAMRCDAAAISLPGAEPGTFRVYAVDFPRGKGFVREELTVSPDPEEPGTRAFETMKPVVATVADARGFGKSYKIAVAEGIKNACFIPLVNRGRALGTLAIARATEDPFTSEEIHFLSQAAGQIAIAIEEEQRARAAVVEGISGLLIALRARDEYTEQHSEHVAEVAVEIGRRRNLPPDRLEMLRLAALMHDLGKIGVRDDVLLKPEELTEEERVRIQTHPAVAADILRPIRGARHIADIVLAHHECPDGSGYPRGLEQAHIPLEAHILHVADVFCSLTEFRPYKQAWSEADALGMMQTEAGSKFETESVRLLKEVITERHLHTQPPHY